MSLKTMGTLVPAVMLFAAATSAVNATSLDVVLNDTNAGDNFLYNNSPTSNFAGSGMFYYDQRSTNNDSARPLLQFDLATLPAGAVIDSVSLNIKLNQYTYIDANNANATVPQSFGMYQMLKTWTEAGSNWNTTDGTTPWSTAGLGVGTDYSSTAVDSIVVDSSMQGTYLTWNITSLYTSWVSNPASNFGVTIIGPAGVANSLSSAGDTTDGVFRLYNTEYADDGFRPHLVIDYHVVDVPEPASATLIIAGGAVLGMRRRRA